MARVALVTGGTRGIGGAISLALKKAGYNVAANYAGNDEAANKFKAETGIPVYKWDVGDYDACAAGVKQVEAELGRIDVLVNNAGVSPQYEKLSEVSEELFDKVIGVNLKGPFRLAALVGERMVEAGGGSIINVSSTGAVRPRADIVPYAAAKAGLNAVTGGLAHAFGPTVRVNAIMCGTFLTDVSAAWDMDAFARRAATFALGRGGQPSEIVGTALYLASDWSTFTTGSVITVDGG